VRHVLLPAFLTMLACGGRVEGPGVIPDPVAEDTVFVTVEGGPFVTSWGDTLQIQSFEILETEVTNRLYAYLADEADIDLPPDPVLPGMEQYMSGHPDCPAVNMTAFEAESAAAVIGCRLPTPAEWEYAAMKGLAGRPTDNWPWGTLPPDEAGFPANYLAGDNWDLRNQDGFLFVAPVRSFPLSSAGLADLAGNVSEWTRPDSILSRVYGGAWLSPAEDLLVGRWVLVQAGDRAGHIGFRMVRGPRT
jgi:formylglycine-generating enzyme required for sulfatase activity